MYDGRLYVLDNPTDEETEEELLELHSLTLEGRPTQPPLRLDIDSVSDFSEIVYGFQLSASPEGIYISEREKKQVRRVVFAGRELPVEEVV